MSDWNKHADSSQNIQAAIWLIGLGILWLTGQWWPGILILIGLSMVAKSFIRSAEPEAPAAPEPTLDPAPAPVSEARSEPEDRFAAEPIPPEAAPAPAPQPAVMGDTRRLPNRCPMCGAPVQPADVVWRSVNDPACSFCSANLITGQPAPL